MTIYTGTADGSAGRLEDVPEGNAFRFTFNTGPFGTGPELSSTHLLLSHDQAQAKLKIHETSVEAAKPGNPVTRIDHNYLPASGRGEDRIVTSTISKKDIVRLARVKSHAVWEAWAHIIPASQGGGDDPAAGGESNASEHKGQMIIATVFDGHGGSPALVDVAERTFHQCVAWAIGQALKGGSGDGSLTLENHLAATLGAAADSNAARASRALVHALIKA